MDCKEKALSNDVFDYITDFPITRLNLTQSLCYTNIENLYNIVYYGGSFSEPGRNYYYYHNIPQLYGLMGEDDLLQAGRLSSAGGRLQAGQLRSAQREQAIFDPSSLIASGITQVQRPPLSLTGRGCIVCSIDTGVDWTQDVFRDENGNSRILAIWDQTIQEGTPPEGFLYGTEYGREDINRALQAENPYTIVPSRDENGHGTAMAAVAAGSNVRTGNVYLGAAPEADIVVVKLKECKPYLREFWMVKDNVPAYQENDIMLAVKYCDSFAVPFTRPMVICLGMGTNMGDHTGSSALARYLNTIAIKRSRAVVVCGGNEGNAAHHFHGQLEQRGSGGGVSSGGTGGALSGGIAGVQNAEVRVGEGVTGFSLELWGKLPDVLTVSVRTPGGETVPDVRLNLRQSITYGFIYERSRLIVDSFLVEASSGEQLLLFRLQDPTPGIWTFQVAATGSTYNGEFDMWLPIRQFLSGEVYFLSPSPYITLTEPSMARDILSVSTYNAENNSFYVESGRGFARDGAIKPDLAAPGVNVSTPTGRSTGSSLAAAITAGAVAQFLQWAVVERNNEYAEGREIKSFLIRGASRDPGIVYPSREWGDNGIIVSS